MNDQNRFSINARRYEKALRKCMRKIGEADVRGGTEATAMSIALTTLLAEQLATIIRHAPAEGQAIRSQLTLELNRIIEHRVQSGDVLPANVRKDH